LIKISSKSSDGKISGFTAACVLVSNVIGSGIFTTTGFMARDLGDPGLILGLWLAGAFLAMAGALSYSELGAMMPQIGGEYLYLRKAYGPFLGFLSGWASFTVGFSAAIAAGAVSFAVYLLQAIPTSPMVAPDRPAVTVLALILVWILTGWHLFGVAASGRLQRILTISKVGTILALLIGTVFLGQGSWDHLTGTETAGHPHAGAGAILVALVFVMYAYSGWNAAGYIAGEIVAPERALPRAMIGGTLFIGCVYLSLNLVYLYALPIEMLARPPLLPVAEKAAVALFGPASARFIAFLLCVSITAAVSAMIWAGPRVYVAMAKDGLFPAVVRDALAGSGATRNAILLQSTWATILILSGTFEQLVIYTGLVLTAFTALGVGSVIVLRLRHPELPRPFRVPLYPLVPCFYLATAAAIILFTAIERPVESALGAATILAGAPVYFFSRKSL
jgi:APA family basic amino acid/polyamine antiporter